MQFLEQRQADAPYSGTFAAVQAGVLGSPALLQPGALLSAGITGAMGYFGGAFLDRPPLVSNFTGTFVMNYTADLGANVYQGISGCYVDLTVLQQRNFLVLLTLCTQPTTTTQNWRHYTLDIGRGPTTGVYPPDWYIQYDANVETSYARIYHMHFLLLSLPTGTYRIQAYYSPWGKTYNETVHVGAIAVV